MSKLYYHYLNDAILLIETSYASMASLLIPYKAILG